MKSILLNFISELRASYWYIPLLMSIVALLLSILTLRLDYLYVWHWLEKLGWYHANNTEGAKAILSTIASSMITVAGVTFSMTIVAVAFAGSQVGPRLTSNFMRDRANQITLGTFIATFLYCLFILLALFNANKNGVAESNELILIPQISLLTAIFLTISSIIVLIYFIHHIPESINISNIIARVAKELNHQIDYQFPINIGKELSTTSTFTAPFNQLITSIHATKPGYIRILDGNTLIDIAKKHDLIIQLEVNVGAYLTEGSILLSIYSSKHIEDSIKKQCVSTFAVGDKRNQEQDILFLVDEMIEIIARALSPGINDPFTAMTCLDWLQSSLHKISNMQPPSPYRYDEDDKLRFIAKPITFSNFCELIFCRVQPYVCRDRNTALHMMNMIVSLHSDNANHEHQLVLVSHAISLKNAAVECLATDDDRKKIISQFELHFT